MAILWPHGKLSRKSVRQIPTTGYAISMANVPSSRAMGSSGTESGRFVDACVLGRVQFNFTSRWPIRSGGLQSRKSWCDSITGFHFQTAKSGSSSLICIVGFGALVRFHKRRLAKISGLFSAPRNPGAGQNFTDLAAAVQLRLRVRLGCKLCQ